ncbi:class I SAM-dependent methyltransferase [Smaragdicoccus niigatensis]|uniref:class I SAM-dependent methyltransferase n=1 Tax=Smaragdicoccus niigatensis TaxID=359359 RepID=UPI000378B3A9|nr:class I SAM-dependent methyltransferase [Smaragdicoccus niigatensis]
MATRYKAPAPNAMAPNNSHAFALQMIGWSKRVLELGAACGDMTQALKNQSCEVTVIEYDEQNRAELEGIADRTIIGDLNDPATLDALDGPFDAVLAGDVLEHLLEPGRVLKQVSRLLAPGGRIVVSLPNVAHHDVRLALLEGRWDYAPLGLLDSTHIRFFTRKTIRQLVASAGLMIVDMRTVKVPPFGSEIGAKAGLVPDSVLEQIRTDPDHDTYQFVFTAVRYDGDEQTSQLAEKYADLRESFDRLSKTHQETHTQLELLRASKTLIYTEKPRAVLRKVRTKLKNLR